jgi:hypothetical protein
MLTILDSEPPRNPIASSWSTAFEPGPVEPTDTAAELAVARYLDEMQHCGAEMTASSMVKYCQRGYGTRGDFKPGRVLKYTTLLSTKEPRLLLRKVRHRNWHWIAMSASVPDWITFCPRMRWRMDKHSGKVFWTAPLCDNWRCRNCCAEAKANTIIGRACILFLTVDRVWHAVIPFDGHLHEWLRQRVCRERGGALWVHRNDEDNVVHVYATADLSTRERPNLGTWMEPLDALRSLIDPTLVLPGVHARRWLGTWALPPKPKPVAQSFNVGSGPAEVYSVAVEKARAAMESLYGVGAVERFSAVDIEIIWLPAVKQAVDVEWGALMHQRAGLA